MLTDFQNTFIDRFTIKFANFSLIIPPRFRCVTRLPCYLVKYHCSKKLPCSRPVSMKQAVRQNSATQNS